MRSIKFLVDREVKNHLNEIEVVFKAGEVYELNDASAERWIRRNVAEYVEPKQQTPKPELKTKVKGKHGVSRRHTAGK